jgi:hypothetical protein
LQALTPLGKALRWRDADLVSAWERDYGEAIKVAIAGDVKRVVNLLRAHRALGDDDFDALADYVEATAKHGHRRRDATIHQAARLAETLMGIYGGRKPDSVRARAIDIACKQMERETGEVIESERVRDLLNRPKRRRSQP